MRKGEQTPAAALAMAHCVPPHGLRAPGTPLELGCSLVQEDAERFIRRSPTTLRLETEQNETDQNAPTLLRFPFFVKFLTLALVFHLGLVWGGGQCKKYSIPCIFQRLKILKMCSSQAMSFQQEELFKTKHT